MHNTEVVRDIVLFLMLLQTPTMKVLPSTWAFKKNATPMDASKGLRHNFAHVVIGKQKVSITSKHGHQLYSGPQCEL